VTIESAGAGVFPAVAGNVAAATSSAVLDLDRSAALQVNNNHAETSDGGVNAGCTCSRSARKSTATGTADSFVAEQGEHIVAFGQLQRGSCDAGGDRGVASTRGVNAAEGVCAGSERASVDGLSSSWAVLLVGRAEMWKNGTFQRGEISSRMVVVWAGMSSPRPRSSSQRPHSAAATRPSTAREVSAPGPCADYCARPSSPSGRAPAVSSGRVVRWFRTTSHGQP